MKSPKETNAVSTKVLPDNSAMAASSGYDAVRQNAVKHGLTSSIAVLPHEDATAFDDLHAELRDELQPQGRIEVELTFQLATVLWRARRVPLAEVLAITEGVAQLTNEDTPDIEVIPAGEMSMSSKRNLLALCGEPIERLQRYDTHIVKQIKNIVETLAMARKMKRG